MIIIQVNIEVLPILILNYSEQRILTINMHGGSNYDFLMIIKELTKELDTVSVLPENTEKYIPIYILYQ